MSFQRIFDIPYVQAERCPQEIALSTRINQQWISYNSTECLELIDKFAGYLYETGLRKGDKVLMIPSLATTAWVLLDFAAQRSGIIVVSAHTTMTAEQLDYIIAEAALRVGFVANEETRLKLEAALLPCDFCVVEDDPKSEFWQNILKTNPVDSAYKDKVAEEVKGADLATIIYTSGTTGVPKGVMLTHSNLLSNTSAILPLIPVDHRHTSLSFLPYSHIFERSNVYTCMAVGLSIHFVRDMNHLSKALVEVRPHFMTAVPRILEKMYELLQAVQDRIGWVSRKLLSMALHIGSKYDEQKKFHPVQFVKIQALRWLIFRRLNQRLGGRVKAIVVGAAHFRPQLARIFAAAGVPVREGYGMTETSPAITVNRFQPGMNMMGTVGIPIAGVKVKIDSPDETGAGEVMVKGPNVMQGYYNQPKMTKAVLSDDGWLRTGDVGKFVKKRFLQITDRKKDIFKTSSGKYIAPAVLETHFMESDYIQSILILGFQRKYVTALIMPNYDLLRFWCSENGIHWTSPQYMAHNIKVREKMQEEIDELNESLASHEVIRGFYLMHEDWSQEKGQLSNTMKPIRRKIADDFKKEIELMYA